MDAPKSHHSVITRLVFATDEFEIDAKAKRVRHRPSRQTKRTYADVVAVYAYAVDADANVVAMVHVTRADLDVASKRSPRVWSQYPEQCAITHAKACLEIALFEKQMEA